MSQGNRWTKVSVRRLSECYCLPGLCGNFVRDHPSKARFRLAIWLRFGGLSGWSSALTSSSSSSSGPSSSSSGSAAGSAGEHPSGLLALAGHQRGHIFRISWREPASWEKAPETTANARGTKRARESQSLEDLARLTVPQIKQRLRDSGVPFHGLTRRDELLGLLRAHEAGG